MSASLAKTVNARLQAGALVVIVQEPDELLALEQVRAAAEAVCQPVRFMSGCDPAALEYLEGHKEGEGTLVLSDFLAVNSDPMSARLVREVALQNRTGDYSRLVLIEGPSLEIPPLLRSDVEIVKCELPTVEELLEELSAFEEANEVEVEGNGETRYALASAVAGLARHEAAKLFARCWVEIQDLEPGWLRHEKARRISQRLGGALSFENELSADVGGLDALKSWLAARKAAFGSAKAKAFGLPEPKGLLLLGVPGCGKSLSAKTIAREWELPLLRLDAGKLFGIHVGQSEQQTRAAVEAAEACAPCVLWIDEVEKGLGGANGSSGDSGTTQRVFGTLLTWLQEKTSPVFVVATANRVASIPPELLRKGRFDEIFFVDLPDKGEREEIARIHLDRRGRTWTDWGQHGLIAKETEGFSGAEIEQAVIDGLFEAFSKGAELSVQHVVEAAKRTTPLVKTMGEEIKALRSWAQGRTRLASSLVPSEGKPSAKVRRGPVIGGAK